MRARLHPLRRLAPFAATALLLATGCTVGPDYIPPEPETPDSWHMQLTQGLAQGQADFQTWWTLLDDPALNRLIGRSLEANTELRQAVARVYQGRARLGIAKGRRVPEVNSQGSYSRQRFSDNILGDPGSGPDTFSLSENNLFSLGLDASWELDLWGRVRRSVESASYGYQASIEDYRDVLVTLLADVAFTYVENRTAQTRLEFARKNAELQAGAVRLTRDRRSAGLVGDLDVRQAELNLARTESAIPRFEEQVAVSTHRLSFLTGELPHTLYGDLSNPTPIPSPPAQVTVGLPVELIRQRPDIRRAERRLASQTARIGVVTAELYPRFSISGQFTVDSTRGYNWFDWSSRGFGIGPTFSWNLFSGGRIRSQIARAEARTEEAVAAYEQAVLRGYEEVENALVGFVREQERAEALQRSVTAASESVRLVEELYRLGLTDFQNVLVTQRILFEEEDKLATSRGRVTQNLIGVYKAVGGGWAP
jgi:NodT family efflux transporter outer membrane factor (OMF) lipoprotein